MKQDTNESSFTISPDDRWLIFERWSARARFPHAPRGLIALDLHTGVQHVVTVSEKHPWGSIAADCWTPDSRFCLAQPRFRRDPAPELIIDFSDPAEPAAYEQRRPPYEIRYADFGPDRLTCSDCVAEWEIDDRGRYFHPPIHYPVHQRTYHIVEGRLSGAGIVEEDHVSGRKRRVASFRGRDTSNINRRLRLSPDGRRLAVMVTRGSAWRTPPELYLIDLERLETALVAFNVYEMRWDSKSERLFFYQCEPGRGACGGEINQIFFVTMPAASSGSIPSRKTRGR